ncbi:MAG: autotransporter-associated beta strand repeat-containing protein [Planctomycetales bacterium]|nr:autotransporter-associated beta strand repeat-containing protein [Planctomycetales bacterium]
MTLFGGGGSGASISASGTAANTSGGLTKLGAGILTLSGANTYTGGTTISAGTLALGAANVLADTGNVTIAGGTFDVATFADTVATVSLQSGAINGTTGVLTSTANYDLRSGTVAAILAGSVGISKTTSGTVTLSGANTFSQAVNVTGGVLSFATSANLGNASATNTLGVSGGTLRFTDPGPTAVDLGSNRVLTIGASGATLEVTQSTGILTLSGGIAPASSGNLIKSGVGTVIIPGSSGWNAGASSVDVQAGTLQAGFGTGGIAALTVGAGGYLNMTNGLAEALTLGGTSNALTLVGGARLLFELGAPTTGDRIIVGTGGNALTSGGVITLDFLNLGGLLGAGTYNLLSDPSGGGLLTGGTTYALGTAPGGFNYTINQTANLISLSVVNFVPIYWRGGVNASWSTLGAGPANWTTDAAGTVDALAIPGSLDTVIFSADPVAGPSVVTTLDGNFTIDGLQFRNNGNVTPVTSVTINQGTSGILTLAPSSTSGGVEVATNAGAVTVSAPVVASNANVAGQTWSVAGGGANGSSLVISGGLTINALINKTGAGALTLSGSNSGAGGLTLTGGTLNIDGNTALGTGTFTIGAGTVINNTSGALRTLTNNNVQNWNGNFAFTGTNSLNLGTGAVTLGGNVSILASAATLTVGGAIDDNASTFSLAKAGAGTLVLSGANAYDGLTDLIQGVLTLGGNNVGAAGGVTMASGTTLNLGHASALGTGVFTVNGGTIDNSSGGALVLGTNNLQNWNAGFTFTGSNNLNLGTGAVTLGATTQITASAALLTVGGVIDDGANVFGLTKTGAGSLTLSAVNTYKGATVLNQGALTFTVDQNLIAGSNGLTLGAAAGSTAAFSMDLSAASAHFGGAMLVQTSNSTANTITIGSGRTLAVDGSVTIGFSSGANTTTRLTLTGASGTFKIGDVGAPTNLGFQLGNNATSNFSNAATLDMSALGTFYANLGAGTFRVGDPTNSGGTAAAGSTLILAATSTIIATTITSDSPDTGVIQAIRLGSGSNEFNATTITIGGASNRANGSLNFNTAGGTIKIRSLNGAGRAALNVQNGDTTSGSSPVSTVDFNGHDADLLLGTLAVGGRSAGTSGSGTGTFSFNQGTLDATTLNIAARTGSTQTTGNVTGTVNIGGGTSTITTVTMATNSSSASTTGDATATLNISGGTNVFTTVTMGVNTVAGATASDSNTNATINVTGGATTVNTTFTMGAQNSAANAATTINNAVSALNISAGSLTLAGSTNLTMGQTTLDAENAAAATISISGGSLTVGGNIQYTNGLGTETNTLTLSGTGLLDMTGGNIGSAAALITFNAQAGTLQNLAQFNGGAGLVKTTSGTLILEGTNSYTGGTTISGGILQVGSGGATGTLGSGTVVNDATLTFNRNNAYSMGDAINGSGQVVQAGSGTTTLSVANGYAGLTSINSGVLHISNGGGLGTTAAGTVVAANAALELSGAITTLAESLTLSGSGVSGGGALRSVSGTNTFLGVITLAADARIAADAGLLTLDVASGDAITGTTAGLTFSGAGSILVADDISLGTGGLTKTGGGIVRLAGVNSYTGQTTISGGVLTVNGSLAGTSGVQVTAGTLNGGISGAPASISASVTVASGATVSAGATSTNNGSSGNGVGRMNITGTAGLILDPGSLMVFDFAGSPVSGGNFGTDWDYFNVGSSGVTLSSTGSIFVSVDTWLDTRSNYGANAGFSTSGNVGDMANPAYSWLWIANAGNLSLNGFSPTAIPGSVNSASLVSEFVVTTTATFDSFYSPVSGAGFWVSAVGNDLYMNYSAVPEPGSLSLVGLAGLGLAAYRRRKRKLAEATENAERQASAS